MDWQVKCASPVVCSAWWRAPPHTGWWHPFRHRGWAASLRISRSARGRLIAGGFANTCAFEPLLVDIWTETSTLLAWKQAVNIGQRTGPCPCAKAGTDDCGMGALHQRPSLIATCAGFKHPFQAPEGQLCFFVMCQGYIIPMNACTGAASCVWTSCLGRACAVAGRRPA